MAHKNCKSSKKNYQKYKNFEKNDKYFRKEKGLAQSTYKKIFYLKKNFKKKGYKNS